MALPRNIRFHHCACIGSQAMRSRNFSHSLRGKIMRQPCGCLVMVSWLEAVTPSTSRYRVGTESRPLASRASDDAPCNTIKNLLKTLFTTKLHFLPPVSYTHLTLPT